MYIFTAAALDSVAMKNLISSQISLYDVWDIIWNADVAESPFLLMSPFMLKINTSNQSNVFAGCENNQI